MIAQGTPEWFHARRGKVTASRVGDLERTKKGVWSAKAFNYMVDLVAERITGEDTPSSLAFLRTIQWGKEHEEAARAELSTLLCRAVWDSPFNNHPTIPNFGGSPDGVTEDGWLLELKCPESSTMVKYLLEARRDPLTPAYAIPEEYVSQCSSNLLCAPDAPGVVFAAYDPRFPAGRRLYVAKVPRDALPLAATLETVVGFLAEVEAAEAKVRG